MNKKRIYILFCLISTALFAQQTESNSPSSHLIITPELLAGVTAEPNSYFPEHSFQKQLMLNLAWDQMANPQEWAQRLKGPRTGIGIGYADFGNQDSLGFALTLMPFIEFNAFKKKNLKVQVGMGGSYFNKKYDSITNPNNQAVTTHLTWSFRLFMHYQIISTRKFDWRVGAGYFHHSNGHARIPNQGYNSFLFSVSTDIKSPPRSLNEEEHYSKEVFKHSVYSYFIIRSGYGFNALSKAFNEKKDIYTFSGEYGKVFNNTFKLGIGLYYRFYQNYYDYIVDNESLVQDGREFDYYKENPWWYASNIGASINSEILLNHIGIDIQMGFNLHKPGYKIDWRINQGWAYVPKEIPEDSNIVLGEFDTKYKLKALIATRLGLKYYFWSTTKGPEHNLFIGAHLNANLGQADFSELSLGYVYNFEMKNDQK